MYLQCSIGVLFAAKVFASLKKVYEDISALQMKGR